MPQIKGQEDNKNLLDKIRIWPDQSQNQQFNYPYFMSPINRYKVVSENTWKTNLDILSKPLDFL